jgi:adenylate kinase family enzyme
VRVYVAGQSGSGKTTFARQVAGIYGLHHYESDMLRHPGRPEYVSGAEISKATFAHGLRRYARRPDWVIDGILYDRALRREIIERADEIVYLALPLLVSELHVFRRRLRRSKRITFGFLRRRAKKGRQYPAHRKRLEADLEPHAAKTVRLRSHREISRYLAELRMRNDGQDG